MRRHVAIAVLLLAPALTSCTDDEDPARPQPSGGAPAEIVPVQRLLDVDPATLPVLHTRLPRRMPDEDADLPSVLDDPPGLAVLTYHPPETWFEGPRGWATEDILFYGDDGEWRRLRMEDLGLPDSAWFVDTYGPGSLSPDGRWWIAPSGLGVILLDLASAEWEVLELDGTMSQGELEWIPGEAAFIAMTYVGRRHFGFKVSVPGGEATRAPFLPHQVGYDPDGTPLSVQNVGGGNNSETGELQAVLTYRQRRVPVEAYLGWLDPETLLLKTRTHVLAWRTDEQQMYRVMDLPEAPKDLYWTVSAALAQPGLAGR